MFTMLMALAIVGGWQMFLTANVVNSLACYNCTSSNEDCSRDQIRDKPSLQVNCPSVDDVCGMAFTIQWDTRHRRILNRTCWTRDQLRDYEGRYGRELIGRLKVPSVERIGQFELVELRLSHCNRSLCNSRYPDSGEERSVEIECYFCSSLDNPSCDFDGIHLKEMNGTALHRCPLVGGPFYCAMIYKTRIDDSSEDDDVNIGQPSKVVVSRTCLSSDDLSNYQRQLGSDLVGIDRDDSALETHLFHCSHVSGCNWRFPGAGDGQSPIDERRGESTEEEEVTSCYVCNDKSSSTCSLSAADSTEMDDETVRRCPADQSHGCVLWYKVQLDTDEVVTVVRSCLSSEDADTYRASYDTIDSNTSIIYVKEDAEDRSIYFLSMCFQSRCNLHFPVFQQQTPFCFICSENLDDKCDAEGSGLSPTHLDRCQHPSDLCSLSYVVRLSSSSGQQPRPSDVRRSCLSRKRAGEYQQQQQRHSSTERGGDLIVIPVRDQFIADTHLYLCRSSECNRRLPDDLRDSIPEPALRCFTCSQHMPSGGSCGAEAETGAFVSRCEGSKGEDQRCFMSYVLAADGSSSHFNRSCVSASEVLSLRRRFGPELIATDVGAPDQLQHHRYMFHCKGNLCNRRFPSTTAAHQSTIDCYTCGDDDNPSPSSSSSTSSFCGVDGSALPASALRPCSIFDRFFCAIVAKYNMSSSSPEALFISMRRSCISERDATAYTTKGVRLEDVDGGGGGGTMEEDDDAAVVVYEERESGNGAFFKNFLFICRTNGCNTNFPQLSKIVERHQGAVAIGVPGPVINEARKTKPSGAASSDGSDQSPPRSGASHSKDSGAAHRPILALGSHLATVATLIVASSVFGR